MIISWGQTILIARAMGDCSWQKICSNKRYDWTRHDWTLALSIDSCFIGKKLITLIYRYVTFTFLTHFTIYSYENACNSLQDIFIWEFMQLTAGYLHMRLYATHCRISSYETVCNLLENIFIWVCMQLIAGYIHMSVYATHCRIYSYESVCNSLHNILIWEWMQLIARYIYMRVYATHGRIYSYESV